MRKSTMGVCAGLALSTMLLLGGCGQSDLQAPKAAQATRYEYNATVTISPGDTQAGIEQRYGGAALVWQPEAGFAVLGLHHKPAGGQLSALDLTGEPLAVAANLDVFGADGTSSAWSGKAVQSVQLEGAGRAYVWSGGRAYVWSGGNGVVGGIPENSEAWNQIGLPVAWAAAPKLGEGIKVAVIDTGIDLQHEMFQGSLVGPQDQWDFVNNDPVPQEEGSFSDEAFGHGTNVASIVLQIAPHAKIMPLRVLTPNGGGDETTVAQAINFAVAHGARVINLSLGSVTKSDTIKRMVDYAASKGVAVIASSGNTGNERITFPAQDASGKYMMAVGSVDHSDKKSDFSTYGDRIGVMAPGEVVWGPVPGNLFSYWSGTSMAAPMVAGSFALALGQTLKAGIKPEDLMELMRRNAQDVRELNKSYGYGDKVKRRLDVGSFILAATQP
ncbi:peptidase S8 and S53 subtilisin kexin sedolisin [Deinococcus irradiatisoli]|uniref:Peptidase S8 and S53 subtilisin kexin sedolisin n=1 Tax=Deinococcus irradiatisoli TaxID=2202254 RepID=A0A2Z3JEP6_9DEIO|nr:S8 family serine peptidase [Deinococcus irradiatisoli]AWN22456.1 peptidase S8 and S53 subtilisin kexin sedolisin [Deinococcus irradiatisoli]